MSSIRVTCVGCHTRFEVSDKFAGKEGPCPKCKKTIKIPSKSESVTVHERQEFGPKSTAGKAVFKPIARKDLNVSAVQMVLIGAIIFGFLAIALMMRFQIEDHETFKSWLMVLLAIVLAVPCVAGGYRFLKSSELGSFDGQDFWTRVGLCAVVYGISWLVIPLISMAIGPDIARFIGMGIMFVIGCVACYLFLGIDFVMAILHFGMYFGCAILLRTIAGFTPLPYPAADTSKMDDVFNEGAMQIGHWFAVLIGG